MLYQLSNCSETSSEVYEMSSCGASNCSCLGVAKNVVTRSEQQRNGTVIDSFYLYEVEHFTVLWILFVVIVIGNSGVLYSHFIGRPRKSRMKFFIAHLAFADLTVGLISVLTDIVWRMTVSWYAGDTWCRFIKFSQGLVTYASTYVLVSLSIDRYDAIRHPMKFSGSWRRARILIIFAWAISALFSLPMLFLYKEKIIQDHPQCWLEFNQQWKWQVYMVLISLSLFVIPAIIITTCYAIMIKTIWTKSEVQFPRRRKGSFHERIGSDGDRRASSRGLIPRAKVKTIKITLVIVTVFILCWSPYIIFDLLQVFGYIPDTQKYTAIASFIQSLAPLNSAANPIIYGIFSTHICKFLGKIAPFKWCKIQKRRKPRNSTTKSSTISEVLTNTTKRRSDMVTSINKAHTAIVVALVHEKT
ncbi:cardioacceleratory peptide receptor-like [Anthonomus grandis grandis]|uniref:cardioacceleratory peptide receptor-like n=1 Tax=Anthonomus grandis grandis TaxID=2921223 RepID=UPI002165015C|nr:cardioacceleratory peptide receptor-like [Anthonomus grandis grandis]